MGMVKTQCPVWPRLVRRAGLIDGTLPGGVRNINSLSPTRCSPIRDVGNTSTSRNPRNGAAILAVPRLNLLCSAPISISTADVRACYLGRVIRASLGRRILNFFSALVRGAGHRGEQVAEST